MKFFRLDLLTLLISLFILNSCKNQDAVGLGVNTTGQVAGALVDTSTIVINTVREDSVITSGLPKTALAYFNDPIFGLTRSDIATDLNLPNSAAFVPPGGTLTIDSARLILKYADGFYGDSITSSYTVNVYQLQKRFSTTTSYYNDTPLGDYTGAPILGSLTFNARTHDSVKIFNIIAGAPDTLMKVAPQIRIPISTSFINQNLFDASNTTLGSNSIFQNLVRGLFITIDKTKTTGPGGIFMIKNTDSLAVYYKNNTGTTIDTAVVYLPITNLAANISHTYTTTVQAEIDNKTTSGNVFYLQGLAGLRAKVSFPHLLQNLRGNLLKKDSDIVLNRAELVITPAPGTDIPYSPIRKISMYRLDIAHQRTLLQDASTTDARSGGIATFGGYYNSTQKEYHFLVTAYLQDLILGKTKDYGTYIAPIDTTNTAAVDIAATPQIASRTAAVGTDKSNFRIKLNIIYTKISRH